MEKRHYIDGKTVITAKNMNDIQDAILGLEGTTGDVASALDELHAYALSLVEGGAES